MPFYTKTRNLFTKSDKISLAAYLVLFLGVVIRVYQFLLNRSFWLDEVKFAMKVENFSYKELLFPELNLIASYDIKIQSAPIGFFYLSKFFVELLGNSEYVFRLIPLIFSLGSLYYFYKLANKYLESTYSFLALVLFAFNKRIIYYSAEFHQYSSDVFMTIVSLLIGLTLANNNIHKKDLISFSLLGMVMVWFSYPSIFLLGGVGLNLMIYFLWKKDHINFGKICMIISAWIISFYFQYIFYAKYFSSQPAMIEYWSKYMLHWPIDSNCLDILLNAVSILLFNYLSEVNLLLFFIFLSFYGAIILLIKKTFKASLLLMPLFFCFIAALAKKYPIYERASLFISPILYILIATGLYYLCLIISKTKKIGAVLLVFLLLFTSKTYNCKYFFYPIYRQEIRPLMASLAEKKEEGDVLYVYYGAYCAFQYYEKRFGLDKVKRIDGISSRDDYQKYIEDLRKVMSYHRAWIIFSHINPDEVKFIISFLDRHGHKLYQEKREGVSLFLYTFDGLYNK